ncbi:MAG: M28 family peptidase [Clostridiales bacterium]|jgi:hypothetical protein|nr:M28 family peptidase [Clostridiales bacterium]
MIEKLNADLCADKRYRVRAHGEQKADFFGYVKKYMSEHGYDGRADGDFGDAKGAANLVFGDETKAEIFLTAHYDTPKNAATLPSFFVTNKAGIVADVFMGLGYIFIAFGVTALLGFFVSWYAAIAYFLLGLVWAGSNFSRDNEFNFNDNTSGCIAIMEIAAKIAEECPEMKNRLCFVFFDREETGAQGSKKFRKRLLSALQPEVFRSKIFLNFDCVGGRDKDLNIYVYTEEGQKLANQIKAFAPDNDGNRVYTGKESKNSNLTNTYAHDDGNRTYAEKESETANQTKAHDALGDGKITVFKTSLLPTDANNFRDAAAMTFISTSKRFFYPLCKLKDAHTKNDRYLDEDMIGYYTRTVTAYIRSLSERKRSAQ